MKLACLVLVVVAAGCKSSGPSCEKVGEHMVGLMGDHTPAMADLDREMSKLVVAECEAAPYTPVFKKCVVEAKAESDLFVCMGAPPSTITCAQGKKVGPLPVEEDAESARMRDIFSRPGARQTEWEEHCELDGVRHGSYRRIELADSEQVLVHEEELGAFETNKKTGTWKLLREGKVLFQGNYAKGGKEGVHTTWDAYGSKVEEQEFKNDVPNGVHREWSKDDKLVGESHYVDGQKDGTWTTSWPDGAKKSEATYKLGTQIGASTEWYESGKVKQTASFNPEGEQEGPYRELDEDGRPLVEGQYTKGEKSGVWRQFRTDGTKLSEGTWQQGKRRGNWKFFDGANKVIASLTLDPKDEMEVEETDEGMPTRIDVKAARGPSTHLEFFDSGSLRVKGAFVDDKKEGLWVELDGKGNPISEMVYKGGLRNGAIATYHPGTKQLAEQGTMEADEWTGPWKQWHDNGQLHFEGVYVKGKRDGHWNEFHPKGHKWREGTFRMGEKIGTWTTWDRQGGNPTTEQFPP